MYWPRGNKRWSEMLKGMGEMIWPRTCHGCGRVLPSHLSYLCTGCKNQIQEASYAKVSDTDVGVSATLVDTTMSRLAGCPNLEKGISWVAYRPGTLEALLLTDIKYKGYSRLARYLGRCMAKGFLSTGLFDGVDLIVPIPLHPWRHMQRGYNQSMELARGVADVTGRPLVRLLRARYHKSQTSLTPGMRESNVAHVYRVADTHAVGRLDLDGKHILMVDDVCTTGATIVHASRVLTERYPGLKISVLTLALTAHT